MWILPWSKATEVSAKWVSLARVNNGVGAGEMTQWLKALTDVARDPV